MILYFVGDYKMDEIKIGDKIVYQIQRNDGSLVRSEISTVIEVGERYKTSGMRWYLVTHPKLMNPKVGRWVFQTDIIEKL